MIHCLNIWKTNHAIPLSNGLFFLFRHLRYQGQVHIQAFDLEVRTGKQAHFKEAGVVFDIFNQNFGFTQRMRCLQFVAWICHFSNQGIDPIVQFQFEHAAVFGCANVFALDQFEIVGQTGEQENIRQTGIDAAVCRRLFGLVERRFLC